MSILMGMGEPLQNYDAVMHALDILRDRAGLSIGAKQITISTVGVVPGIIRLADEAQPCSLAVSLHAATQVDRAALIPAARAWPLADLLEACRYYTSQAGPRIFFRMDVDRRPQRLSQIRRACLGSIGAREFPRRKST